MGLGAEAAEHQRIQPPACAVEVGDGRAVGAAGVEHEAVVAVIANQSVRAEGDQRVGVAVAGAGQPGTTQYSVSTLAGSV